MHSDALPNGFVYCPPVLPPAGQGSLAGLRLAVKDVFHIKGIRTCAGNPDWAQTHAIPEHTSHTVERLVQAGAQLVGKTLTDELAYSLNGINQHYVTPLNHSAPGRLPGGSSSGSAVAVADGTADIGLGTDTGGSIRVPASYNGVFGLRPTHGTLTDPHMVPLAPSFDTIGWMTRDLENMRMVTETLLPESAVQANLHAAWLTDMFKLAAHGDALKACCRHSDLDITPRNNVISAQQLDEAADAFRILQGAEIWQQHGEWIQASRPGFADDIAARFAMCSRLTEQEIARAEETRQHITSVLDSLLSDTPFLLIPTTPGTAPRLDTSPEAMTAYRTTLLSFTALAGLSGLPQLHIPFTLGDFPPVGLSVIGPKHSEHQLLAIATLLTEQTP